MSWTTERWQEIERIFHDAAHAAPAQRALVLDSACAGDSELRTAVERLLDADRGEDELLDGRATDLLRHGDPLLHRNFGSFRLLARIADGGMGTVYRAERQGGDFVQPVAVKVLRLGLSTERMRERFARERQTLARLLHPNVARLLDGGTTDEGVPYFAMELVDGVRIDHWCEERRLSERGRLELFAVVCRAVHFAHQNLVVHRDLKPGNILVDSHGVPKLVDFGVATLLADAAAEGAQPPAQQALTPGYASPEQLHGGPISTASDVWSLGVVLCELLTGARDPAAAVAARRPLVGDVHHVVHKALHAEPARRYASCQEFADDLDRCLRNLPVRAREQTLGYRGARFLRRNRLAAGAVVAVLIVLAIGIAATLRMARIAAEERDLADAARTRAEQEMEHARVEAASANAVATFLGATLLEGEFVDSDAARARLRELVERRAGQIRRQHGGEPHLRANLLDALAHTAAEARLFAIAAALIDEVEQIRREHFGSESLEMALCLASRGRLLYAQGRFDAAAIALREALRLQTTLPAGVHTDVALACNDLAAAERALGNRGRARELHERALALRRAGGEATVAVAESLNNLANAEDDHERARAHMAEAVAIRDRILGSDDLLTLQSKINLARIDVARRDFGPATKELAAAATVARSRGDVGREVLSMALSTLAYSRLQSGDVEGAVAAIDEAIALDTARFGSDDLRVGRHHEIRASVLGGRGDRAGAVAAAQEWVRIARIASPPASLPQALITLGRFHNEAGNGAAAVRVIEEALQLLAAASARPLDLADAKANLGCALVLVERAAEAEVVLLEALAAFEQIPARAVAIPRVRAMLARALTALGRHAEAARYTDRK